MFCKAQKVENLLKRTVSEASELKNVPKCGKHLKGEGEGVSPKNQKVHNSKCGLFNKRGGRPDFQVFPKCKFRL